ncbi:Nramp family divalent metal transporter [soil metagenome]
MLPLLRSRLLSALFWSVIAAAFIGPGTVTTAAAAGAEFKLDLLWAIVFSAGTCILLQEAAARLTIASGYSLGEAIARQYRHRPLGRLVPGAVAGAVVFGCAAYQTGNILGAVAGLSLVWPVDGRLLTLLVAGLSGLLLGWGSYRFIASFLGVVVAVMGLAFLTVAFTLDYSLPEVLAAGVKPSFPDGSSLLLIALIGTTIVPYNLFLGSGISKGQILGEMRFGITVAIGLGGLISAGILLVGTLVAAPFAYEGLVAVLTDRLGPWAGYLVGIGLFSAGFTSCVTAPLASALTVSHLLRPQLGRWRLSAWPYRFTWMAVLLTGFLFGIAGYRPVPAIILAQGINGLLLPFITVFLLLAVNDPSLLPRPALNARWNNGLLLAVVFVTSFLGFYNSGKALFAASSAALPQQWATYLFLFFLSFGLTALAGYYLFRLRSTGGADATGGKLIRSTETGTP